MKLMKHKKTEKKLLLYKNENLVFSVEIGCSFAISLFVGKAVFVSESMAD